MNHHPRVQRLSPFSAAIAAKVIVACEERCRERIAALPVVARREVAGALRELATNVSTMDHARALSLAEVADLVCRTR